MYALREPAREGEPLQHVKVLEKVRSGRWKVEWIEPNPGLVDYVRSRNLVCAWKDRRALLRDEENEQRLTLHVADHWPGDDSALARALDTVMESTGEFGCNVHRGVLTAEPETLQRLTDRAGIELAEPAASYRDRFGMVHYPFDSAVDLCRAFAAREPSTVLLVVETTEREWETRARAPGGTYLVSLLNEYRAGWALVRQWAGHDAALAERDGRIKELTDLLQRVMWDLRRPGVDPERVASSIHRALHGR